MPPTHRSADRPEGSGSPPRQRREATDPSKFPPPQGEWPADPPESEPAAASSEPDLPGAGCSRAKRLLRSRWSG